MHRFLRKNRHIIVWIVVFAFVVGGGLFGYGAYISNRNYVAQQKRQAIAVVNKEPISALEFYQRLRAASQYLMGLPSDQLLVYKYQILNSLIDKTLLLQQAEKEKIKVKVTEEDVDKYIEGILAQNEMTEDELKEALKNNNITMADWRKDIKAYLKEEKTIDALIEKVTSDITVTDEEIIEEYERVRVSRIFISKKEDGNSGKIKAEEALAKIKEGVDFAEVAKNFSEAVDAQTGGDVGFISHAGYRLGKLLTEKAFALEVGQVSDIIETDSGYHILKVTERKDAEGEEFEAQKEEIKERLLNIKKAQAQSKWFQEIKNEAKIEINYPHLAGYKALIEEDYENAVKYFEEAVSEAPENEAYYSFLAQAYKGMNNNEKAITALEKAIEIAPDDWELYLNMGQIYKDLKNKEKAIEYFKKASEHAGDKRWAHTRLKTIFTEMNESELAEAEQTIINEIAQKEMEEAKKLKEKQMTEQTDEENTEESSNN
ncbi:SurA N-terminal domain-containing protein [Anoxybacter fermentans]|nr:SurA N-terminal domain-containing protein [Anoxybacter fermentans]